MVKLRHESVLYCAEASVL